MTASGDAIHLPMLNPVRLPFRESSLTRHSVDRQPDHAPRLFRMPRREPDDGFAYGPGGYVTTEPFIGRVIDIYA